MLILLMFACGPQQAPSDTPQDTDTDAPSAGRFGLPLAEPALFYQTTGVDHDPEIHDDSLLGRALCTNYDGRGFPWCYDEHDGTDYMMEGGFDTMDAGSTEVIAAEDGEVVEVLDGQYDRCHGDLSSGDISCDGYEIRANHVILEHADGSRSWYWHLKRDSLLVEVGDQVACGEPLALVGSSGISSAPHLHFEVHLPDDTVIDPYGGEYSQPDSLWLDQGLAEGLPGPCQ